MRGIRIGALSAGILLVVTGIINTADAQRVEKVMVIKTLTTQQQTNLILNDLNDKIGPEYDLAFINYLITLKNEDVGEALARDALYNASMTETKQIASHYLTGKMRDPDILEGQKLHLFYYAPYGDYSIPDRKTPDSPFERPTSLIMDD